MLANKRIKTAVPLRTPFEKIVSITLPPQTKTRISQKIKLFFFSFHLFQIETASTQLRGETPRSEAPRARLCSGEDHPNRTFLQRMKCFDVEPLLSVDLWVTLSNTQIPMFAVSQLLTHKHFFKKNGSIFLTHNHHLKDGRMYEIIFSKYEGDRNRK